MRDKSRATERAVQTYRTQSKTDASRPSSRIANHKSQIAIALGAFGLVNNNNNNNNNVAVYIALGFIYKLRIGGGWTTLFRQSRVKMRFKFTVC